MNIDAKIFRVLTSLGLKTSNKGFTYLQRAIALNLEDPATAEFITKNLYPQLAKEYHTNWSAVERAIRHSILRMKYSDLEETIFPTNLDHYTNKEFITYVTKYISLCA